MKSLLNIIQEKLVINKHSKAKNHNYYNTCDELVKHVNDLYSVKLSDNDQNDIIKNIKNTLKDKLNIKEYVFVNCRKLFKNQFSMDLIIDSSEAYLSHKEFYQERAIYYNDDISVFYESVLLDRQIGITKFLIFVNYKNQCVHNYCIIDKNDINKYNLNENFNENLQEVNEKLVINKYSKAKTFNSIKDLSDEYNFDLLYFGLKTPTVGKPFNYKEYKVSNDLFKNNICDKIVELTEQEIKKFANDLNYHFKDILNNDYTIELTNYTNYDSVWAVIRIYNKDYDNIAQALYDCIKSTIGFKILKDEREAEKILVNVIDYIINN